MTKYFVDAQGNYLGGFDGATPPAGAVEVGSPPSNGNDKWDGAKWVADAATQAAAQRLAGFDAAIGGDASLQAFRTMSKADFDTWWAANVTTAPQAIAVMKKLAWLEIRRLL